MEVLQIVARPLPDRVLVQDFTVPTAFSAAMDFGKILEEEPGALDQRQQRAIMISGKWVEACFYVGEVLQEKSGHVRVYLPTIGHGCVGMAVPPNDLTVPSPRRLRKPTHGEAVPHIPCDAWQLDRPVGQARGKAR
jgi:hypothetical protein